MTATAINLNVNTRLLADGEAAGGRDEEDFPGGDGLQHLEGRKGAAPGGMGDGADGQVEDDGAGPAEHADEGGDAEEEDVFAVADAVEPLGEASARPAGGVAPAGGAGWGCSGMNTSMRYPSRLSSNGSRISPRPLPNIGLL